MIINSQLATLLTIVSLGKTPQTIQSSRANSRDPGLAITHGYKAALLGGGGVGIRFRERSLIEGSESIVGWGLRETRERWCRI